MNRVLTIVAAAAVLLAPLCAAAQGRGEGRGHGRGEGGGRGYEARGYEGRGYGGRGGGRFEGRIPPGQAGRYGGGYTEPRYAPPPRYAVPAQRYVPAPRYEAPRYAPAPRYVPAPPPRYEAPRYAAPAPAPAPRYAAPPPPARRYADPYARDYGPPRSSWGRGDYLPPMYRGAVVQDPGRYRLRQPPPGYDWVGIGPDIYLVQRGTGLVLDAIPGGY